MSERIQRQAQNQARARRRREKNARERAEAKSAGQPEIARLQDHSADVQGEAAADSERVIAMDQEIEGDQLED